MTDAQKDPNPIWLQTVFYFYIAVLPLTAFLSIFIDDTFWKWILNFPLIENQIGRFFYHTLSFLAFFLSGIFGLIIVQNTPLPKNLIAGLYMLLDTPIQLSIDYFTGSQFTPGQFVLVDFGIEVTGIVVGAIYVLLKFHLDDDTRVFFGLSTAFGILILISFTGFLTIYWTITGSLKDQFIIIFSTITSILMYVKAFSNRITNEKKINETGIAQSYMSNFSAISMICLWIMMVYAYGKLLL